LRKECGVNIKQAQSDTLAKKPIETQLQLTQYSGKTLQRSPLPNLFERACGLIFKAPTKGGHLQSSIGQQKKFVGSFHRLFSKRV